MARDRKPAQGYNSTMQKLVFFIDFDNTILDNDSLKGDMDSRMREILGADMAEGFWRAYEDVRKDLSVIDFFETGRRLHDMYPNEPARVTEAIDAIMTWDFRPRLLPNAIEAVRHLGTLGLTMVISDGDPIYQPSKIWQSGIADEVGGRVLIFAHKEKRIADLAARFPAEQYVLIDDKPKVLDACKATLGDRLTTVHVRFGHYGVGPGIDSGTANIAIDGIAELIGKGAETFMPAQVAGRS
jgi:FMN phosphatase YigB (HAD superfamily)